MTRAEIRAYILARLSLSSADTSRVTTINTLMDQVYLRLAAKYQTTTATAALAFTSGTATVTLPTDLVEVLSIEKGKYTLIPVDADRYAELQGQAYTSDPLYYFRSGLLEIRIVPTPTATDAAAATCFYVQAPATLTAGGDSASPSAIPTQFHDLIAELVVAQVAMDEEEFATHASGALATASRLEAELRLHMNTRGGQGPRRVVSARYG